MNNPVIIGDATLYLGDCLEILPALDRVDAVVTDPPYGIAYSSGRGGEVWGDGSIAGDSDTSVRDAALNRLSWSSILCFGSWKTEAPAGTKMQLVWDTKGALGMGDLRIPWKPSYQEIYVLGVTDNFTGKRTADVLRYAPVQSMAKNGRVHPMEKPINLMIDLVGKTVGTILDPFMGSGTTGVACANLGRKFIGIEIEPKYFDIACERIEAAYAQGRLFE